MAPKMSTGMKRATIALAAVLTIASAGTAYAYWTSTGTGDGTATTGTSAAFTISTEDAVGTIVPGGPGQTIAFTVTNPTDAGVQYLANVTATLADPDGTAWVPPVGCIRDAYEVLMTEAVVPGELQPGVTRSGVVTVRLSNLDATNQDACKGAIVPVHLVADSEVG